LNIPGTLDIRAAMDIETIPEVHCLSEPPEMWKVIDVIDDIRQGIHQEYGNIEEQKLCLNCAS